VPREPKVVDVESSSGPPLVRRIFLLLLLAAAAAGLYVAYDRTRVPPAPPASAEATGVRSSVTPAGDSLQVAVEWDLMVDSIRTVPESIRVEVGLSGGQQASVSTRSAGTTSDTLRVAAPSAGQTASGYSCVAPIHRGQLRRESCTPWQFVVPGVDSAAGTSGASPDTAKPPPPRRTTAARAPGVSRIVLQPAGLQVDPDPDGRCTRWQKENPERSVWLEVNQRAVPECTGANGKPMVAQFCAFAELDDGSKVKTQNSLNNQYCERLFRDWTAERVS
jgi:hypothetical protein